MKEVLFFLLVEIFTTFYGGMPEHMNHFQYLLFGLDGKAALVPWIWSSIALAIAAIVLLIIPRTRKKEIILALSCAMIFISVWIDKGLGLVVPGFIPSQVGEVFEYLPTLPEALITVGVWAFGLLLLTVLYKIVVSVREET